MPSRRYSDDELKRKNEKELQRQDLISFFFFLDTVSYEIWSETRSE